MKDIFSLKFLEAAENGNLTDMKKLVRQHDIDVNFTEDGCTALLYSCEHGELEILQYLLTLPGLKLISKGLYYACQYGHKSLVQEFFNIPSLKLSEQEKFTALEYAYLWGNYNIIDYLILEQNILINETMKRSLNRSEYESAKYALKTIKARDLKSKLDNNLEILEPKPMTKKVKI